MTLCGVISKADRIPPKLSWVILSPNSKKIYCVQCIDVINNIDKWWKLFHLAMTPEHKQRIICCSLDQPEGYVEILKAQVDPTVTRI